MIKASFGNAKLVASVRFGCLQSHPCLAISTTLKNVGKLQLPKRLFGNQSSIEYDRWYSILVEFRQRKLTYHSDNRLALSGLAKEFALRTGDTYLAGIWRRDIFRGLSWRPLALNGD